MKLLTLLVVTLLNVATGERGVPSYLRHYAQGPNMCAVQQVFGTREKFYPGCLGKSLRMICERPTFISFNCCSGYKRVPGKQGCTGVKPVENLMITAHDIGLREFTKHVRRAGLQDRLEDQGAFTVFVPSNKAFRAASHHEKRRMESRDPSDPSTILYHMVDGRVKISNRPRGRYDHTTLYKDQNIRINKYAFGVTTVNCARIERPDELATNGVIHVIDQILKPLEMEGSLTDKIFNDDQFSQFQLALFTSNMANLLRGDGPFTVLAPTNKAFAKLPSEILDRILTDVDTAEKVLKHHIIEGVFCKDAVVIAMGLKTLDGTRIMMRCKRDGLYFNKARVTEEDIQTSNGVIHAVDSVIVPNSVKSVADYAKDLRLHAFMNLTDDMGLTGKLTSRDQNITMLIPTDSAFKNLPSQYRAALRTQPLAMERLIDYHKITGKLTTDKLIGDQDINTDLAQPEKPGITARIKVNVYRGGIVVNNAKVVSQDHECENGVIHRIDTVLMPPVKNLMETITTDPDLSTFRQAIETAGLSRLLSKPGQYTVLAPTNKAFDRMNRKNLSDLLTSPKRLKKVLERHIINRMVAQCSLEEDSVYSINSRQGDQTDFQQDSMKRILINKRIGVKARDQMSTNGVLYKINSVMPCTCEPRIY